MIVTFEIVTTRPDRALESLQAALLPGSNSTVAGAEAGELLTVPAIIERLQLTAFMRGTCSIEDGAIAGEGRPPARPRSPHANTPDSLHFRPPATCSRCRFAG